MLKPLEQFAQERRCRRKQQSLSQEGFSEKTGVSMALVSEIERGIAHPTLQTLEKIAAYFQTDVAKMIKCSGNKENIAFIKFNR